MDPYAVQVTCHPDAGAARTTCTFLPVIGDDDDDVVGIELPSSFTCTEVLYADRATLSGYQRSGDDDDEGEGGEDGALSLVFRGRVGATGSAIYWLSTDDGRYPATGPGLTCLAPDRELALLQPDPAQLAEATPATPLPEVGSILVEVFTCPIDRPAEGFDWFGACQPAGSGLEFRIEPPEAAPTDRQTEATSAEGEVGFERLEPGVYELTQVDDSWCHAESNSVDASGRVVVQEGELATVWIFNCDAPAGS
jgi:hypothetical protein